LQFILSSAMAIMLAISMTSASSEFVVLGKKVRPNSYEKVCAKAGLLPAKVTESNAEELSRLLVRKGRKAGWIGTFNGLRPEKSTLTIGVESEVKRNGAIVVTGHKISYLSEKDERKKLNYAVCMTKPSERCTKCLGKTGGKVKKTCTAGLKSLEKCMRKCKKSHMKKCLKKHSKKTCKKRAAKSCKKSCHKKAYNLCNKRCLKTCLKDGGKRKCKKRCTKLCDAHRKSHWNKDPRERRDDSLDESSGESSSESSSNESSNESSSKSSDGSSSGSSDGSASGSSSGSSSDSSSESSSRKDKRKPNFC